MPIENADFISELDPDNPFGTDPKAQGDDHIRLTKKTVVQSFPNISEAVKLSSSQLNALTGMISAFPIAITEGTLTGWLLCNGQAVDRVVNADLFTLIGIAYGAGDGTTTFNLPDYRGYFLRSQDQGAGIDLDAATRTDRGDGTVGDAVGTKQPMGVEPHTHDISVFGGLQTGGLASVSAAGTAPDNVLPTVANGGLETRPVNINVLHYIHI